MNKKLLERLPVADDMKKSEIIDRLLKEEYGYLPDMPRLVEAEQLSCDERFCAGKAHLKKIMLKCIADFGEFSFPVYYTQIQGKERPLPCFIHINFRDDVPDKYQPSEELVDLGYNVISFCYKDVTSDDGDFTNGLAGVVYPNGRENKFQCGKIGLWAWAAMRVMDYALTLKEIDSGKICVAGHSRLGKTALLAGALDERFYCAFSNDSGCSGASLARENKGETIEKIYNQFPFWFNENYAKYINNEDDMPFDQHYLIAANYPHKVYVASAEQDWWACPENEFLSCIAAGGYYEKQGVKGFVYPDRQPETGELLHEGNIGYHKRAGRHYFSREDWLCYIKFLVGL